MLALATFACDAGGTNGTDAVLEADSETLNALSSDLAASLNLSAAQQTTVDEALARLQDDRNPGALWELAGQLQATLSDEQKTTLLERPSERRSERGPRPQGVREPRGFRSGGGRPDGIHVPDLTDEQRAVLEPYREQMRTLMGERRAGTLSDEDFSARMEPLRDSMEAALADVLTAEQRERLETMKARRADRGETRATSREDREARRRQAEAARQEVLALSAEQQASLEALREEQQATLRDLRDRAREGNADRSALRDEARGERDAHEAAMAEILDTRQLETVRIHQALVTRTARANRGRDDRRAPKNEE